MGFNTRLSIHMRHLVLLYKASASAYKRNSILLPVPVYCSSVLVPVPVKCTSVPYQCLSSAISQSLSVSLSVFPISVISAGTTVVACVHTGKIMCVSGAIDVFACYRWPRLQCEAFCVLSPSALPMWIPVNFLADAVNTEKMQSSSAQCYPMIAKIHFVTWKSWGEESRVSCWTSGQLSASARRASLLLTDELAAWASEGGVCPQSADIHVGKHDGNIDARRYPSITEKGPRNPNNWWACAVHLGWTSVLMAVVSSLVQQPLLLDVLPVSHLNSKSRFFSPPSYLAPLETDAVHTRLRHRKFPYIACVPAVAIANWFSMFSKCLYILGKVLFLGLPNMTHCNISSFDDTK